MKIRVTPTALNDLKEIKSYIENDLSNPIAANNVIKRIIEDYSRLEISPHMGPSLSTKVPFDTDYRLPELPYRRSGCNLPYRAYRCCRYYRHLDWLRLR